MQAKLYPQAIYPQVYPLQHLAMDEFETRKRKLREYIDGKYRGNVSAFCRHSLEDATYINRIFKGLKPFTETIARRIEVVEKMPDRWLDDRHASSIDLSKLSPEMRSTVEKAIQRLGDDDLPADAKLTAIAAFRHVADQPRQIYPGENPHTKVVDVRVVSTGPKKNNATA